MANDHISTLASTQELRHERYSHGDFYYGSRDAIIAAGIACDGSFPGDPGRNKSKVTLKGPLRVDIVRQGKARYRVYVEATPEVYEAREARERTERELQQAQEDVERRLALLPSDRESFRRSILEHVASLRRELLALSGPSGGYALAEDALECIQAAFADVVDAVTSARITFNAQQRAKHIAHVRGALPRADSQFQAFLALATAACNVDTVE